jgi:hypothetical protein
VAGRNRPETRHPSHPRDRSVSAQSSVLKKVNYNRYWIIIKTAFWVLSAIYGPCSVWIAWQPPMKGELRWRGANSISKFDHHNINGGAVDSTWRHR